MTKIRLFVACTCITASLGCSKPATELPADANEREVEERLERLERQVAELQQSADATARSVQPVPTVTTLSPEVTVNCDAFAGYWNSVEFTMTIRKSGEQFVVDVASDEAPRASIVGTHVASCESGALHLAGRVATLAVDGSSLHYNNAVYRRR